MQLVTKNDESPVRTNAHEERLRRNLDRFIEDSGYSTTQVADMTGIAQASLARYRTGQSPVPVDALPPLADALGRSVEEFFSTNPAPQRTKEQLAAAQPMFARSRPGFEPTEEDLAELAAVFQRIQSRRDKKPKPKR